MSSSNNLLRWYGYFCGGPVYMVYVYESGCTEYCPVVTVFMFTQVSHITGTCVSLTGSLFMPQVASTPGPFHFVRQYGKQLLDIVKINFHYTSV